MQSTEGFLVTFFGPVCFFQNEEIVVQLDEPDELDGITHA